MRYRKMPVVIDAFQMTAGHRHSNGEWPEWLHKAWSKVFDEVGAFYPLSSSLLVRTLEGPLEVSVDDWIIRGVQGELYPRKPDIFAATYEEVIDEARER